MRESIEVSLKEIEPQDRGVDRQLEATEEFHREGEEITRETVVSLLEDGGIHFSQNVQGLGDSLTLSSRLRRRLTAALDGEDGGRDE